MTIFLAGLNTIPKSYYEAAQIDGANFWQRLRYVTLPMLSGAIMINLVFGITYGLKVFDIVYVLTNGGPGHATEVLTTYAFQLYSRGQYGMSSALNTVLLVITAIIGVFIVKTLSKQEVQQYGKKKIQEFIKTCCMYPALLMCRASILCGYDQLF